MTLCPIAVVAGCKKCPAFSMCPLKTTLGDHIPEEKKPERDSGGVAKKKGS